MLRAGDKYAVRRRTRLARDSPKQPSPEGTKSNPSKRHRDRLNQELSNLATLLPFPKDVCTQLDKLSILRLAVGFLKAKGYLSATLKDRSADCPADPHTSPEGSKYTFPQVNAALFSEEDLLLQIGIHAVPADHSCSDRGPPQGPDQQALYGFLLVVAEDGSVIYVSPTVQDYLGFQQPDIIYQNVFELIHREDRATFQSQFYWPPDTAPVSREAQQDTNPLPGEGLLSPSHTPTRSPQHPPWKDTSYLERNFVCRFRCLLDNSSRFLELNFQGHLKFLSGQNKSENGILLPPQLTLFALATPCQPLTILELQSKTVFFQSKHKLDFTPIACDFRGTMVLGYTESELCMGSGYRFIHLADVMYCAEKHRQVMMKGDSGLAVFRLLTKRSGWLWVQSIARLLIHGGQPQGIIAQQWVLSDSEGEEFLRQRDLKMPFTLTTGEAILYEDNPLSTLPAGKRTEARRGPETGQLPECLDWLLEAMVQQDKSMCWPYVTPGSQGSLMERLGSGARHEDKGEEEMEEGSLLALIDSLLEKGAKEQLDLCSTLQHLGVSGLEQQPWEEKLLGADFCPTWPLNCPLPPPNQGGRPHREKETLVRDSRNVDLAPAASTSQTLKPVSPQGSGRPAMDVTPPGNLGTMSSHLLAQPQHFLITRPPTPGPQLQSPLQTPLQWGPQHSQAAPLNFGIYQEPIVFDQSLLPGASIPNQPVQVSQPSSTPSFSLGENVPGHMAQPGPDILDLCADSMPWTRTQRGQCQGSSSPSGPIVCADPCATHPLDSTWDFLSHDQSAVAPVEGGALQAAQPDPSSHLWVGDPCLPCAGPASNLPPSLCQSRPWHVQGALGTLEEIPGGQGHLANSLAMSQLSGSAAYPSQVFPHGPSAMEALMAQTPDWPLSSSSVCRWSCEPGASWAGEKMAPSVQHPAHCQRDAIPPTLQPGPFLSLFSDNSSPYTGDSCCGAPVEPTRQTTDRPQVPPGLSPPPCPPAPAWPPTPVQSSYTTQLQQCYQNEAHSTVALPVPDLEGRMFSSKF